MGVVSVPSLFPDAPPPRPTLPEWLPPGFQYHRDFLSVDEEAELLEHIEKLELRNSQYHEYTARRRTAGFGLRWDYDSEELRPAPPAPDWLRALAERVAAKVGFHPGDIPHALVTHYPEGAPIGWHRDAPPFAVICGISLASDCAFRLRPQRMDRREPKHWVRLTAERRSLYVMAGPSRSDWQHSIAPVKQERYSITMRTMMQPHRGS